MTRRENRQPESDETIRLPRFAVAADRGYRRMMWVLLAVLALAAATILIVRPSSTAIAPGPAPLAGEADLLAEPTDATRLFRYRQDPAIFVLLFDSVHGQALALNRAGAFVEKAGMPRDHVLDSTALDRAIAASGEKFDSFYDGHDYRAADLRRFFADAARQSLSLRPEEASLRARLEQAGLLAEGAVGALISVPPVSPDANIDAASRRTILRHELSHGFYFTDPDYAAYVTNFWDKVLTESDRARFRAFLTRQGYDPGNEDLLRNECQAYLIFTDDPRYFSARAVGLPEARIAELRRLFLDGLPGGWLEARGL